MSTQPELVANVDLDGTVANFNKGLLTALNLVRNPIEPVYTSEHLDNAPEWLEERMGLIKRSPGFWRNLETIPLGMQVVDLIRDEGFRLNVLTKGPRRSINAWSEKVAWSQEHLPDAQVTITQDKGLVYGRVLFDDWPTYITRWLDHRPRGLVLMLDHSWNQNFQHPNVIRISGPDDFGKVQAALLERTK